VEAADGHREVREEQLHPADEQYLEHFPAFVAAFGGAQLLAHGLDRVDADGLPAYLETPNPRTIPFYERHGFAVTGQARAGACPPVTCMLRPPGQAVG
jgi:hypothetical protein